MLRIDQSHPFIASWNESNAHLNSNRGGFLEKTVRKIKNFIFFIPNCMAATCVNPRGASPFSPSHRLIGNYGSFKKEIITPDGVHLAAHVHIVKNADLNTPTVILFNPLGTNDSIHDQLKTSLIARECNVVTFNYRGLGSTWQAEDLITDGESVYQYVTQELGTNENKIHFYGFSLGGALAAQVKALHPESEGKYVGDRPFKSVFSLITENCCIERFGQLIKKITSLVSAIFIAFPIYLLGWEWDGGKAWPRLNGDKCIVYHPNDCLIPFEASLASHCSDELLICLDPTETGPSTHFSPLNGKNTDKGENAVTIIAEFLSQ